MTTITQTITPLPSAPTRDDPTNFSTRGDALMTALPTMVTELNTANSQLNTVAGEVAAASTSATNAATAAQAAAASALGTANTNGTSTTSNTISSGSKTFVTQTDKVFPLGASVKFARTSDPANYWMVGTVTAYNSSTGQLDVSVALEDINGGGVTAYTAWTLSMTGHRGARGFGGSSGVETVASAATVDLSVTSGDLVDISGNTGITTIVLPNGMERTVRFAAALTLTNSATLVLPGNADITTAAGDEMVIRGYPSSVVQVVSYQRASGFPIKEFTNTRSANIASAATLNLDSATGGLVDVTGTTGITSITLADGQERVLRFTGALTLTNGANLVLPGGQNITTAAGDYMIVRGYASGVVRCVAYTRATGVSYFNIPQKSITTAYTVLATDMSTELFHPSADVTARTWTIDSNANMPVPVGSVFSIGNDNGAGVITVAITTDTLRRVINGVTGSLTIAAPGFATFRKVKATEWQVTGVNIS